MLASRQATTHPGAAQLYADTWPCAATAATDRAANSTTATPPATRACSQGQRHGQHHQRDRTVEHHRRPEPVRHPHHTTHTTTVAVLIADR
jgi:hypothetical protein